MRGAACEGWCVKPHRVQRLLLSVAAVEGEVAQVQAGLVVLLDVHLAGAACEAAAREMLANRRCAPSQ